MASPAQTRKRTLERLSQAEENYAKAKEKIKGMRSALDLNNASQSVLYEACHTATAACHAAATIAAAKGRTHCNELAKLRAAEATELSARQALEDAQERQRDSQREELLAKDCLQHNEDEAKELRAALPHMEDELSKAEIALENCKGEAKAAEMSIESPGHVSHSRKRSAEASPEGSLPKRVRTELITLPLKTWTTGRIFSPCAGEFVRGYPHASNAAYSQSFIVHLDTGNSAQTIISRTAFDFLGLGQSSTLVGHVNVTGVHGKPKRCPLYEIKYTIDTVNLLKPGTMYQRTAKAAVLDPDRLPSTEGYYDLLLCAEDCRKWSEKSTDGKKLRIEILDHPPSNLYDKAPLQMACPFGTRPQAQQPNRQTSDPLDQMLQQQQQQQQQLQQFTPAADVFEAFFGRPSGSFGEMGLFGPSGSQSAAPDSQHNPLFGGMGLFGPLGSQPPSSSSHQNLFSTRGPALVVA